MNRFELSITNLYEELKRNSAIPAFISLAHFVTSGRTARGEQVVKKRVRVAVSKKNPTTKENPQNTTAAKKHQTITALSKASKNWETSALQPCWFKDANKASFISRRQSPLFAQVLQLDDAYRHTTFSFFPRRSLDTLCEAPNCYTKKRTRTKIQMSGHRVSSFRWSIT